jgi:colanic acid/amylovoran biosynthesis protein
MLGELAFDLVRMFIIYFGPFLILKKVLFTPSEQKTLKALTGSDIVITKGGSFICNVKGLIGFLRFIREMTILVIAIRMNKKVVIWGQSIGPVDGFISLKLVNWILEKVKLVVLREKKCLENYPCIVFPKNRTVMGYDLAFNIVDTRSLDKSSKNYGTVGITIRRFKDQVEDEIYSNTLKEVIEYLIFKMNKTVVIVPHVTIDDDTNKAMEIYKMIDDKLKERVQVLTEDYSVRNLLKIYNEFDFLIGTRLHSTIFAMAVQTKAINIGYHGTKSSGVFENFNISEFVIEGADLTADKLINTVNKLVASSAEYLDLENNVLKAQNRNLEIADIILRL